MARIRKPEAVQTNLKNGKTKLSNKLSGVEKKTPKRSKLAEDFLQHVMKSNKLSGVDNKISKKTILKEKLLLDGTRSNKLSGVENKISKKIKSEEKLLLHGLKSNKLSGVENKISKKSKLEEKLSPQGMTSNKLSGVKNKISKKTKLVKKLLQHGLTSDKISGVQRKTSKKTKLEDNLLLNGVKRNFVSLEKKVTKPIKNKKSIPVPTYSTPKDVHKKTLTRAVKALLKINEVQSNKNALFSEETVIFLQIVCVKVPECPDRIVRFKVPHTLVTQTSEVCLIVSDKKKGKRFDHEPQIEFWKDLLEEKGVTEVKTVLPMRQLKTEFDQFELKRRLKTMHDFFLVDAKISGHVSHILGKLFKNKNTIPTPVRIGKDEQGDLKKTIQDALHKAPLRIHNAVSTAILRVGHIAMKQQRLCENIRAVIDQLDTRYPGGSENVRSIHIKTPLSIAIPIYITLKPATSVKSPQIKPQRPKMYKMVEDELSTIPGTRVQVTPDGHVKLIKIKDKAIESDNDTDKENSKPKSDANIELKIDGSDDNSINENESNDDDEDTHNNDDMEDDSDDTDNE